MSRGLLEVLLFGNERVCENSSALDGGKLKGIASVRLAIGRIQTVELHWYEAHGIGKRKLKIKRYLD
jgi:hypothetical protein